MKASEVLKRYATGERNFQRVNLRGQSFKGKDLSGADFSEADIRSTNFTGANLRGTNFTGAKCGLQKRWATLLVILSWLLAGISVLGLLMAAALVILIFDPSQLNISSLNNQIAGFVSLIILVALFILIICRGVRVGVVAGVGLIAGVIAAVIAGVVVAAIIITPVVEAAGAIGVVVVAAGAVGGVAGVSGVVTTAVTAGVAEVVAGLVPAAIAVAVAGLVPAAGIVTRVVPSLAAAGVIKEAGVIAVAGIIAAAGAYVGWRAIRGDERDAWMRSFVIVCSTTGGTSFRGADLTEANFTGAKLKSTDLRRAILTRTCWRNVKKLDRVRPGTSYLSNAEVRELVRTGQGQGKNFDYLDELRGINLKEANLTDASFIGSNLNRANLQGADLSRAKLVQTLLEGADLTDATLTGAYIQDWGISHTTKIIQVNCDYIFMKLPTAPDPDPDRRPADPTINFKPGEFADLVGVISNTVDLVFEDGIDWKAFLATFTELQEKYQDNNLSIAAIEKKNTGAFVVKLNVSEEANKALIEREAKKLYEENRKILEAQYTEKLLAKEEQIVIYKEQNTNLLDIIKNQAAKPFNQVVQTGLGQKQAIIGENNIADMTDKSKGVEISNLTNSPISGVAGGDLTGQVSVAINSLPNSENPNQPGIKELLEQLKDAIATDTSLEEKQKEKLLKRVKSLADAALNPNDETFKERAEDAIAFLKNNLPATAAAFTVGNTVLPAIAKILGF